LGTVGPGTRTRQTMNMMTAGATRSHRTKVVVDIFFLVTNGKLISALLRENCLLLGVMVEKTAARTAETIMIIQSKM